MPFAREYGGLLDNRSFGGAQVSRTFYARGQTGQQLLLGAYQALDAPGARSAPSTLYTRTEMLDLVVKDGRAAGIVVRDLITGEVQSCSAHAVVLGTGGYGNVFYLSTNAKAATSPPRGGPHKQGRAVRQPVLHADPPHVHPGERRLPVEAHADVGVAAQRRPGLGARRSSTTPRSPDQIPEDDRDYFLERRYPAFGNLVPRDVASRAIKREVDAGRGVGPLKNGVYLDFAEAIERLGDDVIEERYGNLFEMYERITDEDPYKVPMRIYPAVHYTMGGLWVDYNLMSNVPGLFVLGEANFSDHGANRLGASALMQGLADGYFVLPYTIGDYLAPLLGTQPVPTDDPAFTRGRGRRSPTRSRGCCRSTATQSVDHFHRELGNDPVGQLRHGAQPSRASRRRSPRSPRCARSSGRTCACSATNETLNQSLEKAGRVADFFEFGELLVPRRAHTARSRAAATSASSTRPRTARRCATTRTSPTSPRGSSRASATRPTLHKEPLEFEYVHLAQRSYK